MEGRIIKGIAGFYYVHDGKDVYECKAKGIFRKDKKKPLVGDHVRFDVISVEERTGHISEILERRNSLIRPEVANVDQILLVFAAAAPQPNYDMLNRYLVMVHDTEIPVHLLVNKTDLADESVIREIRQAFSNTCYDILFVSAREDTGISELREVLGGRVTALAGPSGVGKSSLMNRLLDRTAMETGELSKKIDRGKNTTRHSELFFLGNDTYLFDTPGFSSVEPSMVLKEDLQFCFDEFKPYIPECRYLTSCMHIPERECDCAVKRALEAGKISRVRYDSYRSIYDFLKDIRRY